MSLDNLPPNIGKALLVLVIVLVAIGGVLTILMLQGRVPSVAVSLCSILISISVILYSLDRIKRRRQN